MENELSNLFISSCNIHNFIDKNEYITIIQKYYRRYNIIKYFSKLEDNMTLSLLKDLINRYNNNLKFNNEINTKLSKKKIRQDNFPSHISENIVKFAIFKKYKIMPSWDTNKGDLIFNKKFIKNLQIEVKGFMSDGPSSFGPKEDWDWLYFIDCKDSINFNFKIFEIKLSNKNEIFRSIKLNKKETFGEIADNNQRGKLRGSFYNVFKKQLPQQYCNIIFDGNISKLI